MRSYADIGSPRLIPSRRELAIEPLDDQPVDPALATDAMRRNPTVLRLSDTRSLPETGVLSGCSAV